MNGIDNVSRRRFLTGGVVAAGALVLGVRGYPKLAAGDELPRDTNADHATLHPSVYLRINPDGHGVDRGQSLGDGYDKPHDSTTRCCR